MRVYEKCGEYKNHLSLLKGAKFLISFSEDGFYRFHNSNQDNLCRGRYYNHLAMTFAVGLYARNGCVRCLGFNMYRMSRELESHYDEVLGEFRQIRYTTTL